MNTLARGGIKLFSGKEIPQFTNFGAEFSGLTSDSLRDLGVWRPEDTINASLLLSEHGKLLVEGEAQTGKGTILFGISRMFDVLGWAYVFIDGHHQEARPESITHAIDTASRNHQAIFYDSFDYLFLGSGKIRRIPVNSQQQRTAAIVKALSNSGVPVVGTIHGPDWEKRFINQQLLQDHEEFFRSFPVYQLSPYVDEPKSVHRFLLDHDIPIHVADAFITLGMTRLFVDTIIARYGDKAMVDMVNLSFKEFAVLKKLVREQRSAFLSMMGSIVSNNDPQSMKLLIEMALAGSHEAVFLPILRGSKQC